MTWDIQPTSQNENKYNHEKSCFNPNDKIQLHVHEFIRLNGNRGNWDMIEIETRCCENSLEARRIEREHIEYLNAALNKRSPYISEEEASNFGQVYMKEYKRNNKEQLDNYNRKCRQERRELINEKAEQHKTVINIGRKTKKKYINEIKLTMRVTKQRS